jgi:maltose O-acetyltransferase
MGDQSEKDKMLSGALYLAADPALLAERLFAQDLLRRYNQVATDDVAAGAPLLRRLLGAVGANVTIRPVFGCDYGYNIRIGQNVFVNFNCVFLDCAAIEIGDGALIGPAVQIYTATHPLDPALRRSGLESAHPVRVGANAWIGGGAILLPGITVGEDAVVAAGSVVTRDVAAGQLVAGNPARPVRRDRPPG